MYPDDCIQSIISSGGWWEENEDNNPCRGTLLFAYIPHVDQTPYQFVPIGRDEPRQHQNAKVKVEELKIGQHLEQSVLPVAAMTKRTDEVWSAHRAKARPCLVVSSNNPRVDKGLTRGKPKHATAPTVLVAPYYGIDKSAQRAGYTKEFVELVRHCEFPQFVWDCLPIKGPEESLLRLDHMQPIGSHYNSYKLTNYKLKKKGMNVMDDMLSWLIWGGYSEEGDLGAFKELIKEQFSKEK